MFTEQPLDNEKEMENSGASF